MFAEDVGLLPDKLFEQMLDASRIDPAEFEPNSRTLFEAMRKGGRIDFKKIEWFNGGLFDTDGTLPLEKADILDLIEASKLDWSDIDPSILGTLFERGLDPDKRSQLGAHYTDRDKIMMIVRPVIVEPLLAEWAAVKSQIEAELAKAAASTGATKTKATNEANRLRVAFMERLTAFRVLDPACGSGNFLYLALLELKNLEHRVNLECEALGLPREFPRIGPEAVLGIELNPYAAELARVSVWIGEIQWMRRNGFEAARNPVLRSLNTIENRDAVLAPDGSRAEWPKADVVVGNPPFLGGKKLLAELGPDYVAKLRTAHSDDLSNFADLVCFWFVKAWGQIKDGNLHRAGLVTTNSIRGGANREALKPIVDGGRIFTAWSDEDWTLDGAAVRVSMVCFDRAAGTEARLDNKTVPRIFSDLTGSSADTTAAVRLTENASRSFVGIQKTGDFNIPGELARQMLTAPTNPNGRKNSQVLAPYWNGIDLTRRQQDIWLIDFPLTLSEADAALFEMPFAHLAANVRPVRATNSIAWLRDNWWLLWRARPDMRAAVATFERFIVTPEVSKYRVFAWMPKPRLPDKNLTVIARDDDTTFGILHSKFHEIWALRMGTSLEDRPRYTPSTTFETFPFPEGLTPNIPAADYASDPRALKIAAAAARLNELRENWLNPADQVIRVPEVVPGYPDRILPKDEAAAKVLKLRTLTNLYNQRPTWLQNAHAALDEALAEAYGWGDDWRAGKLTEDEILARLFKLNQERAKP